MPFKYQAVNAKSLANLTERQIWFSSPRSFNDPYDCALQLTNVPEESVVDAFMLARRFSSEADKFDKVYAESGAPNSQFRHDLKRALRPAAEALTRIQRKAGVACFSATYMDILMWSHYADGHRGFCVSFDPSQGPFKVARTVSYGPGNRWLGTLAFLQHVDRETVLEEVLLTKADKWSYEQELRIIRPSGDEAVRYKPQALHQIYLGAEMPDAHCKMILRLLELPPEATFRMRMRPESFELNPYPTGLAYFGKA